MARITYANEYTKCGEVIFMKPRIVSIGSAFLTASLLLVASTAGAADQQGLSGPIKAIHLRGTSASSSAYWNYIVLQTAEGEQIYYWGGSVCPGKDIRYASNQDTMVDALSEYATYPDMCITPLYRNGQGQDNRCLVAYTAFLRVGDECEVRPR